MSVRCGDIVDGVLPVSKLLAPPMAIDTEESICPIAVLVERVLVVRLVRANQIAATSREHGKLTRIVFLESQPSADKSL